MEQEEGYSEDQDGLLDPINFDPHSDISAAFTAIEIIGDADPILMSDEKRMMIEEIKEMALIIAWKGLKEIYYRNFYEEE